LSIPWVHIIDLAAAHIHEDFSHLQVAGVLQTDGCGRSGLYRKRLHERGFEMVTPYGTDDVEQARAMEIAYHPSWGVKSTGDSVSAEAVERLRESVAWLARNGAEVAVTGCTEFSAAAALLADPAIPVVDPLDVLARATVEFAMGLRELEAADERSLAAG
jgi:aspartate racemase